MNNHLTIRTLPQDVNCLGKAWVILCIGHELNVRQKINLGFQNVKIWVQ